MYTLRDYIAFRGDIGFDISPVNEIDEMVFASMGKADYSSILKEDEAGKFSEVFGKFDELITVPGEKTLGLLESPILLEVLRDMKESARYSGVTISHFVNRISNEKTEQMSALTVLCPNGKIYVTFRGTDDTLIGWKENCELAILDTVPAQKDATKYLETVAKAYDGPIVVSGHSKGGNLAVFAASHADKDVQERIERVISYDGPGFLSDFFKGEGYKNIEDRIVTMAPRSSFVGMLMNNAGKLDVIECEDTGPMAHDYFIWNLDAKGFIRADGLSEKSIVFRKAINQTIDNMEPEERQTVVDEIFEALESTGAYYLLDLTDHSYRQALKIAGEFGKAKETKQFLMMLSRLSIRGTMDNTIGGIQEKFQGMVLNPVRDAVDSRLSGIPEKLQDRVFDPVKDVMDNTIEGIQEKLQTRVIEPVAEKIGENKDREE